jgi:hypothetical protein
MTKQSRFLAPLCVLALLVESSVAFAAAPIIYPANGQSMEQQGADESQCRSWAQQQTGVSPYSTPPEYYSSGYSSPGVVGGAARGAALGAIGGEIMNDDAGKGAAAGAAMGATAGFMRRNQERRNQAHQNQQVQQQYQADLGAYNNAFAACMQGRGYVVK